jgi:hypothetical protein
MSGRDLNNAQAAERAVPSGGGRNKRFTGFRLPGAPEMTTALTTGLVSSATPGRSRCRDSDRPQLLLAHQRLGRKVVARFGAAAMPLLARGGARRHQGCVVSVIAGTGPVRPPRALPERAAHATKAGGVLWLVVAVRPV